MSLIHLRQNFSKWALPESSADATRSTLRPLGGGNTSADATRSTSWSRPLGAGSASVDPTRSSSWSRSPSNGNASLNRRSNPTDSYMSKWARPSALPEQPRPQSRGTNLQTDGFRREAAPHAGVQRQKELTQPRENNRFARRDPRIDPIASRRGYDNKKVSHTTEKQGPSAARRTEDKSVALTNEAEDDMEEERDSSETDRVLTEEPDSVEDLEEVIGGTSDNHYSRHKMARQVFKERGSIISRISQQSSAPMIPSHSRVKTNQMQTHKGREKSFQPRVKLANLNIYIPSVLSVGNFAKLLKIRLGQSGNNRFINTY